MTEDEQRLCGMKVVSSDAVLPGVVEFRNDKGVLLGAIVNGKVLSREEAAAALAAHRARKEAQ